MSFWKQIPGTTRAYLIILVYLAIMLVILIFTRLTMSSSDRFSLRHLFNRAGAHQTATALSEVSLTATAQTLPGFPPGMPWMRANTGIKVSNGPGSDYGSIAVLESGQTAEIIGVSPDRRWWAIRLPYIEGSRGWVPADQVTVENVDNVTVLTQVEATPTDQKPIDDSPNVRAFANVNIRSGPDMFYEKIGLLKNGEKAKVVGISPDGMWWAIALPGKDTVSGWVARDYVIPSNTNDVAVMKPSGVVLANLPPTPAPDSPSLTAIYSVNIRAGPGVEYAVVAQMGQGQMAEVVGVSRDGLWVAIKLPSQQNGRGWVASAYVRLANAGNVPIVK